MESVLEPLLDPVLDPVSEEPVLLLGLLEPLLLEPEPMSLELLGLLDVPL